MFDILQRRGRASGRLDRYRRGAYGLRKAVSTRTECSGWRGRAARLACCKLKAPTALAGIRDGDDEILSYSRRVGETVGECDFDTPGTRGSDVAPRTCPELAGNARKTRRRPFGVSVEEDRNGSEKSRVGQTFQMPTRHKVCILHPGSPWRWDGQDDHRIPASLEVGGHFNGHDAGR